MTQADLTSEDPETAAEREGAQSSTESVTLPVQPVAEAFASTADSGKYKVLAEIGHGGMANVYLAVARGPSGFHKLVVLKCLRSDLAGDPELLVMFLDEARLAARLNHPHVVQTYEVGEHDGQPVIVMEYLEGQTLANLIQRARTAGALSLELHLRVIIDALDGLQHAHELTDYDGKPLNLVHRDVSPHNIFVTFDGQVKVLDFGIAKAGTSRSKTATGILKGKVQYMPPEQMAGNHLDRRADIYAVGVMLWEAAAGQRMWKGASDLHIMNKVVNEGVQSPRNVNPNVPRELEEIVLRALSSDPAGRYATALELAGALEAFLEHAGTAASARQLANVMGELFEDTRTRTRAVIEAQLLEAHPTPSSQQRAPGRTLQPTARNDESPLLPSRSRPSSAKSKDVRRPGSRRTLLGAALLAGVVLTAVAATQRARRHDAVPVAASQSNSAQVATPQVSAAPPAPVAPKRVSLSIVSKPAQAVLSLDGARLATNPYSGVVENDGSVHKVRVEAAGYKTKVIDIQPDRDIDLAVALELLPGHGGALATTATPPASRKSAPPPLPAANACSTPYYVDADGIKKLKPECL